MDHKFRQLLHRHKERHLGQDEAALPVQHLLLPEKQRARDQPWVLGGVPLLLAELQPPRPLLCSSSELLRAEERVVAEAQSRSLKAAGLQLRPSVPLPVRPLRLEVLQSDFVHKRVGSVPELAQLAAWRLLKELVSDVLVAVREPVRQRPLEGPELRLPLGLVEVAQEA